MDTTILVCSECGGDNIQVKAWVDANTNQFISDTSEGEDSWCENCLKHVEFESEDEFELNHPELLDNQ